MTTYPDGREVKKGDVVRHSRIGVLAIATGKNPRDFGPGCMNIIRNGRDTYMDICNATLLRRANEFKVGDECKDCDGDAVAVITVEHTDSDINCIAVLRGIKAWWCSPESLTLIKPVDPSGYHEDSAAMNAEQGCETTKPPWQRRAESKDFEAGDVVVGPSSGKIWTIVTADKVYADVTGDNGGVVHGATVRHISLLRPHDWAPEVGDVIVGITPGVSDYRRKLTISPHGSIAMALRHYAPSELAEPLIPLLRGDATPDPVDRDSTASIKTYSVDHVVDAAKYAMSVKAVWVDEFNDHPCPRHDFTGCKGSIESGECDACGWPGLRGVEETAASSGSIFLDANMNQADLKACNLHNGSYMFNPLNASGETIQERTLRTRWTADFPRTTKHCRLCGRDGGCFCGNGYC